MAADDLASRVANMLDAVEHHLRMNMAVPVPGLRQMVDDLRDFAKSGADVLEGVQKDLAAVADRMTALEAARREPVKVDDKPAGPPNPKPSDKDK